MISTEKAEKIFNILRKDIVQDFVIEELTKISCLTEEKKQDLFKKVHNFYDWCSSISTIQADCNLWSIGDIASLLSIAKLEDGSNVVLAINDIILDDL